MTNTVTFNVNGVDRSVGAPANSMLLYALRKNLKLHGPRSVGLAFWPFGQREAGGKGGGVPLFANQANIYGDKRTAAYDPLATCKACPKVVAVSAAPRSWATRDGRANSGSLRRLAVNGVPIEQSAACKTDALPCNRAGASGELAQNQRLAPGMTLA